MPFKEGVLTMEEDKTVKRALITVILIIGFIILYGAGEDHGYEKAFKNPTDYELEYNAIFQQGYDMGFDYGYDKGYSNGYDQAVEDSAK